jgi:hypothetical protein
MAKAKKQQTEEKSAAPAAQSKPAKKPPTKKADAKTDNAPARAGMPTLDTSLAAQTAARMVARRDMLENARTPEGQTESSAFKQLKENINKPAHGPSSFLQNTAPQKKSNQPYGGPNQVGKNQTFGADVNRTGIPRRTGG